MERTINSTAVREELSTILNQVQFQGDKYIISRKGKPSAAIVPLAVYENWKKNQARLLEMIRDFRESSGNNDPDEIMEAVLQAQASIRDGA